MTTTTTSDGQVSGSAAHVYEQFFVPALFGEWAPRVADATGVAPGGRALDVACGTGVLARAFAARAGDGSVVGVDRNAGMLAVAREMAAAIDWREGRAEELPFEAAAFDGVGSSFGLMFFEDRARALREMWRVLRPGGRLAVAVWGALDDTPGYAAMVSLLQRLFGEAVADELRAPFCLGDPTTLAGLFTEAGLPAPVVEQQVGRVRFASLDAWLHTDVRGWTLAEAIDDEQFAELQAAAPDALARFVEPDGRVSFASPALIAVAVKPT